MERIGIIGLANSGKSSLFNALTEGSALVAPHPFSTTQTNVGIASVPDKRLDALAELSKSRKVVRTGIEFVDIAGLTAGSSTGEGMGNRFLAGIREVDALCFVLRAFEDASVVGSTDPVEDLAVLELELVLSDLASLETQLNRRRKASKSDKSLTKEVDAFQAGLDVLQEGVPIYRSSLDQEQKSLLKSAFLLTNRPVMAVINIGEDQISQGDDLTGLVSEQLSGSKQDKHFPVLSVSVQLEAETSRLDVQERQEILEGLGLGEGALPRVIKAAYASLDRWTFLTTGVQESRAWTFKAGSKAPECAGVIHSDLQRGFIRAEVIHWDELLEIGSWSAARDVGKIRLEGKDYEVKDGDVLEIRFNV